MKGKLKGFCGAFRRSLAIVVAMSMMLSIFVLSGVSVAAGTFDDNSVGANTTVDYDLSSKSINNNSSGTTLFEANATYYDYLSDVELNNTGWRNPIKAGTGVNGSDNAWFPFNAYNEKLSSYYQSSADRVTNSSGSSGNGSWKYPLYFGNLCNTFKAYADGSGNIEGNPHDHYYGDSWGWGGKRGWSIIYDNGVAYSPYGWYWVNNTTYLNQTANYNKNMMYAANNSNGLITSWGTGTAAESEWNNTYYQIGKADQSAAVQGLVSSTLDSDGDLVVGNSTKAPWFNNTWLKNTKVNGNSIGKTIAAKFPFRETSTDDLTTYTFDSTNATDNVSFTWSNNAPTAVNYGSGTGYGIQDGLSDFMNGETSGYGIFPFNNKNDGKNLNYGFGVRIDVDFRVPEGGKINNNDVTFNYSGDDDLWVFIDDQLVLDLGGSHKQTEGSITFTNNQITAVAKNVYTPGSNSTMTSSAGSVSQKTKTVSGFDYDKVHNMTVFYMERGLIESNMKMSFTFTPLDNSLTTSKTVNTADVNAGLKSELENNEQFTITNENVTDSARLSSKVYILTDAKNSSTKRITDSNGQYILKNGEEAAFSNITDTGKNIKVSESYSGKLDYNSTYTVTDVENSKVVGTSNAAGTSAQFKFENSVNADELTDYDVSFVNTPKVGSIKVGKTAQDKDGNRLKDSSDSAKSGKEFSYTVKLDLGYGSKAYNLVYTKNGSTYTATNGRFTLKDGEEATFSGIPANAVYTVTEDSDSEYSLIASSGATGTVAENAASQASFTNKEKGPATVDIQAAKKLDGAAATEANEFKFTLTEVTIDSSGNVTAVSGGHSETKGNDANGDVKFSSIEYQPPEETSTSASTQASTQTEPTAAVQTNSRVYVKPYSGNAAPYVYAWKNTNEELNGAWPGKQLTNKTSDGYYYVDLATTDAYKLVINAGGDSDKSADITKDDNGDALTKDTYIVENAKNYYSNNRTVVTGVERATNVISAQSAAAYAAIEPAEEVGANTDNSASAVTTYYYKISENTGDTSVYKFDDTVYYVRVDVDTSATPVSETHKYYKSALGALNKTASEAVDEADVVFNNYHVGAITVSKIHGDDTDHPISGAYFKLYKVSGDGDENLSDNNLLDKNGKAVADTSGYSGEVVGDDGKVTFDNLDIFVNQSNNDTSQKQWYCVVESKAADGYNINSTKYYFTLPDNYGEYRTTTSVSNYPIVMPKTDGDGVNNWIILGAGLAGTGALLAAGYAMYDRRERKKRKVRSARRTRQ